MANREKRVVMVRRVARKWIQRVAQAEYRLKILYGPVEIRNLPNLLKSLRDGRIGMDGVRPIFDLGVKESFDALEVWSRDREALIQLKNWFEKRGFETSGIW
jgi:hypothetical protein